MSITQQFISLWFLFSALAFGLLIGLVRTFVAEEQPDRDINTFLIILSQGIGATFALYLAR